MYHGLLDQQPREPQDGTPSSKNCGTTFAVNIKPDDSFRMVYTRDSNKTKTMKEATLTVAKAFSSRCAREPNAAIGISDILKLGSLGLECPR